MFLLDDILKCFIPYFLKPLLNFIWPAPCLKLYACLLLAFHRKNLGNRIPVQPTAISRRKTAIAGKQSHVGGRPRKHTKPNVKISHNLSLRTRKLI